MFKGSNVFSGFSADDIEKAKAFYGETLGLEIHEQGDMGFGLQFANGGLHFVYPKDNHQPATFTALNFPVENIDEAMEKLAERGITFEFYNDENLPQDEKGVLRGLSAGMGPDIAWFKDPAGNVLSVLQEK